jgi:DNA-binding CsgD family transcriptional regulator
MRPYDEVGLLVRPDNDTAIMFSFGLTPQAAPTRARQIALLQSAFPMFAAAIERHWARVAKARLSPGGGKRKGGARSAAQGDGFGATALSAREAEVVDLVLRGHSSHAISGQLGIAEATVKIHRKNAYAKLGVASQAELFARYLHFALSRKA